LIFFIVWCSFEKAFNFYRHAKSVMKSAHSVQFKVPFGDIDWLGHVNNATYLTYFETARAELIFRTLGGGEGQKWLDVIVARAEIDYKSPAKWNDLLVVRIRPVSIGTSSWTYEYEIHAKEEGERERLVARGKTVQVAYDYEKRKAVPIRQEVRETLERQMRETSD
jgi:acyl-CoA thioester hydrolase